MEYTELKDYRLPGGTLIAWEPVADAEQWRADPRRLSYMHLEHVRRAIDEGERWRSVWIGTAFRIEGTFDPAVMARTIEAWFRRHEAFRTSVRRHHEQLSEDDITRITLPPDCMSVHPRPFGVGLSGDEIRTLVGDYFDRIITPLLWPHCVFATVEPDDDSGFVVVFAADHTVMDAYTQVFAIRELVALYTAESSGVPHGLRKFGSYLDFSDTERRLGDQIDANNSAVGAWRTFFKSTTVIQPHPLPAFPAFDAAGSVPATVRPTRAPDPGYQKSLSHWLFDQHETQRFKEICATAGASTTTGIYTALSMAAAALTGHGDLRFISPIHTRTAAEWGEAAGWFVGIIPVVLQPGDAQTFTEALAAIGESAATFKAVGSAPFAPIADLIGGDTTPPGFVVSYIDLCRDPGAPEWDARDARVLRSATADANEVYFWINRIPGGTNVSARYPAGDSGDRVEVFLTVFHSILHQVIADGDARFAAPTSALTNDVR